jgi:hypothetical protein
MSRHDGRQPAFIAAPSMNNVVQESELTFIFAHTNGGDGGRRSRKRKATPKSTTDAADGTTRRDDEVDVASIINRHVARASHAARRRIQQIQASSPRPRQFEIVQEPPLPVQASRDAVARMHRTPAVSVEPVLDNVLLATPIPSESVVGRVGTGTADGPEATAPDHSCFWTVVLDPITAEKQEDGGEAAGLIKPGFHLEVTDANDSLRDRGENNALDSERQRLSNTGQSNPQFLEPGCRALAGQQLMMAACSTDAGEQDSAGMVAQDQPQAKREP